MQTANVKISSVNMEERKKIGIRAGDTVRVWTKVEEKGKTRLQPFEGIVLARKHGSEPGATFTVRRVSGGYGVEKIFPLYSPMVDKIEILKRAKVRRAKLYHIRDKAAREIKRQMRRTKLVSLQTPSEQELANQRQALDQDTSGTGQATDDSQQEEQSGKVERVEEKKEKE